MENKFNAIFLSFLKSIDRLEEILKQPKTVANRDSAIKRFELTFEIMWKVLKERLYYEGIIVRSPRESLKKAFSIGIIDDDINWIKMLEDRNLSVHSYDENLSDEIYSRISLYLELFKKLADRLKQ